MTELEMFAKLPQLDEEYHKTNLGYVPALSKVDNILVQYIVFWFDISVSDLLDLHFIANTRRMLAGNAETSTVRVAERKETKCAYSNWIYVHRRNTRNKWWIFYL